MHLKYYLASEVLKQALCMRLIVGWHLERCLPIGNRVLPAHNLCKPEWVHVIAASLGSQTQWRFFFIVAVIGTPPPPCNRQKSLFFSISVQVFYFHSS